MSGREIEFEGRRIELDERGYLRHDSDWSVALAEYLAVQDAITLTTEHWDVLNLLRRHYGEFRIAPPMRLLVKEVGRQFGPDKANSRYSSMKKDSAVTDLVQNIMGLPAGDPSAAQAAQILQDHYAAAVKAGASPTDALKSTFVLACSAPTSVAVGL